MADLRFDSSMPVDGDVAGPNQNVEHPLGIGGERQHGWAFALAMFRQQRGMEGAEENESTQAVEGNRGDIGASIVGRNMFGGHPGPWAESES